MTPSSSSWPTRGGWRWRAAQAVVVASAALASVPSLAQEQPRFYGAQPQSRRGASIEAGEERIEVRCDGGPPVLTCTGTSTLVLTNPTDTAVTVLLEVDENAEALTVGGATVALPAPTGTLRRPQDEVTLGPKESRAVTTSYRAFSLRGDSAAGDALHAWALTARHPLVGSSPGAPTAIDIYAAGVQANRFVRIGKRTATLRVPQPWKVATTNGSERLADAARELALSREVQGSDGAPFVLSTRLSMDDAWFANGGPLLGIGPAFEAGCPACAETIRGKVGWEVGITPWLILAVSGEVSSAARVVAALTVDGALPEIRVLRWLPQISLGIGLPVRITGRPEVGARGQVSLGYRVDPLFVGVATVVDFFPASQTGAWSIAPALLVGL